MVTIKAPAKINLALDTLYKRDDNYHEVEMIMTTVDLADYITVTPRNDDKIVIQSNEFTIPLNEDCTMDELAELGARLGSDIPFCVYGGTALATGRGEIIHPIPSPPKCWVILIKPRIGVSTKEIYEALNANEVQHLDIKGMLDCIELQDYQGICNRLGNSLESVTFERYPVVEEIKNKLIQFGADAVLMSGSGPTVFALVRKEYKLRRIINSINGCLREHEVYAVRLIG